MTGAATTKLARAADTTTFPLGFYDESGGGSGPFNTKHVAVDASGNIINPALDATLSAGIGAAGTSPPSLASGASGLIGWLRKIVDTLLGSIRINEGVSYETVAASQTDQAMGATGATGDYLNGVLVVPGTTAAGAVSIKDGSGSSITIFSGGGTTALTTLTPFFVRIGANSTSGAWKITTGANVTAIGLGQFT